MKASVSEHSGGDDIRKVLKMAFWDRTLSPSKWLTAICGGDIEVCRNIIVPSFKFLPLRWLVHQIGVDVFVKRWPVLRDALNDCNDPLLMQRRSAWDALWGLLSVGDSQHSVRMDIAVLGRKRRELLRIIVNHPAVSTYDLAKITGRDYSRVHKDVRQLVATGLVSLCPARTAENRAVNILQPVFSVNRELAEASS